MVKAIFLINKSGLSDFSLSNHVAGVAMFVQLFRQEAVLLLDPSSGSQTKSLGGNG